MHYITIQDIQCNVMQYYILKKVHSPLQCKPSNAKSPQKGQIFAHLYSIDWIFTFTHIALCFKNNNFLCRPETNTRIIEDIPLWSSLTIIEIAKSDNKGKGRKTAQSMMHTAQSDGLHSCKVLSCTHCLIKVRWAQYCTLEFCQQKDFGCPRTANYIS